MKTTERIDSPTLVAGKGWEKLRAGSDSPNSPFVSSKYRISTLFWYSSTKLPAASLNFLSFLTDHAKEKIMSLALYV